MPNKERLEELAKRVEALTTFDQRHYHSCVIGEARRMYTEQTGKRAVGILGQDRDVAEYLGLTIDEVDAIYCAEYSRLNIGVDDLDAAFVTRAFAADVLRKLAERG